MVDPSAAPRAKPITATRPPLQERTKASFDRIQLSAVDLLVQGGPENFTMAAVAGRADVSVPAIYRRFKDKDDLLASTKGAVLDDLRDRLEDAVGAAGPSVRDVVRSYATTLSGELEKRTQLYRVVVDPTDRGELQALGSQMLTATRKLFVAAATRRDPDHSSESERGFVFVWRVLTSSLLTRAVVDDDEAALDWADETERLIVMAIAYLEVTANARP